MDHAALTDAQGHTAKFEHTVIIMTTNAGAADASAPMGFGARTSAPGHGRPAIERTFTPEFRNRLDAWVPFTPLTTEVVARVVDKFLAALSAQLEPRHVALSVSPRARRWLVDRGYDPAMGARPLGRLIDEQIKKPLADELLFGRLRKGGRAEVDAAAGRLLVRAA